ncbi:NADH:flavin oxidoreductase [Aquihabitans daechungensis]|uniref:oxidoreductase n=1 Tax=Aquihabitans daechungensis TaxID=1052257 RepID=UPI003B9E0992
MDVSGLRFPQMKKLVTEQQLRDRLAELGVDLPLDTEVDPAGALAQPLVVTDGSAGALTLANRFAVLPMEGWDGTTDGRPTDLVRRRWGRFGRSGCGLVWGEATAVRPDGRANPNQLVIDETTVDEIAALRGLLDPGQVAGMQLTHSGRYARPVDVPTPRTAYEHPILDGRVGAGAANVFTDEELDELAEQYVAAAVLAQQAGFAFVDVKHCHGYFLHELLSARNRPGPYGGDLAGRTRFLRTVTAGIRSRAPGLAVAVRLSAFDLVPYRAGEGGVGEPDGSGPYAFGFGGDGTGLGIDLSETHELLDVFEDLGIGLVSTTAGSPYYNPHIQRPAFFPPSDGYQPPEDPLVGVARQLAVTAELRPRPSHAGGRGRRVLLLAGVAAPRRPGRGGRGRGCGGGPRPHDPVVPRARGGRPRRSAHRAPPAVPHLQRLHHGAAGRCISGCFPIDPFYKEHPQRVELTQAKKAAKARLR